VRVCDGAVKIIKYLPFGIFAVSDSPEKVPASKLFSNKNFCYNKRFFGHFKHTCLS
jgi:hypothetical protein